MYGVSQKFENYFKLGGHATSLEIMNKMKLFVDFVWKESEGQRETETEKKKRTVSLEYFNSNGTGGKFKRNWIMPHYCCCHSIINVDVFLAVLFFLFCWKEEKIRLMAFSKRMCTYRINFNKLWSIKEPIMFRKWWKKIEK